MPELNGVRCIDCKHGKPTMEAGSFYTCGLRLGNDHVDELSWDECFFEENRND